MDKRTRDSVALQGSKHKEVIFAKDATCESVALETFYKYPFYILQSEVMEFVPVCLPQDVRMPRYNTQSFRRAVRVFLQCSLWTYWPFLKAQAPALQHLP